MDEDDPVRDALERLRCMEVCPKCDAYRASGRYCPERKQPCPFDRPLDYLIARARQIGGTDG